MESLLGISNTTKINFDDPPDAAFVWADQNIVFDHKTGHMYLVALMKSSATNIDNTYERDLNDVLSWMNETIKILLAMTASRATTSIT